MMRMSLRRSTVLTALGGAAIGAALTVMVTGTATTAQPQMPPSCSRDA